MPRPVVDRKPKRLGYGTLGLITSGVGHEKNVRLIPGDAWDVGPDGTTISYPREKLADILESLALRSIYANVGHVLHSQEPSPWNAIAKIVKRVERSVRTRTPNGTSVQIGSYLPYGIIRVVERERVERIQRSAYRGLAKIAGTEPRPYLYHLNTKRPPDLFESLLLELDNIAAKEPAGKYLPAEVLDGVDLEPYLQAPTFAQALALTPHLVTDILLRFLAKSANDDVPEQRVPDAEKNQAEPEDQSPEAQSADAAATNENPGNDNATDGDSTTDDATDDAGDSNDDANDACDGDDDENASARTEEEDPDETSGCAPGEDDDDQAGGDRGEEEYYDESQTASGSSASDETEAQTPDAREDDTLPELTIPPYLVATLSGDAPENQHFLDAAAATGAQLSGSTTSRETLGEDYEDLVDERLADVLRQAFDEAIEPNRRWGILGNLDRGKLQMKAVTKAVLRHGAVLAGRDHVYGKRLREDKKRIRIAMLSDNSGSMRLPVTSAIDPNTTRIQLAARFVVSAITAVEHLPEVEVGVWTFDESVLQVVPFGKHAATDTRKAIGKQMITTGGSGTDAPLAIATLRQISALPARPNTQTFLMLITDGEWGYGPGAPAMVTAELQALLAEGVDVAVFTIGCDAAEAKTFVGEERADEITDDTASDTIKDHIYRLLHPVT